MKDLPVVSIICHRQLGTNEQNLAVQQEDSAVEAHTPACTNIVNTECVFGGIRGTAQAAPREKGGGGGGRRGQCKMSCLLR